MSKKKFRKKNKNKVDIHSLLKGVYLSIPETTGCLDNILTGKKCGAWCCTLNNPQLLKCEFLNVWSHVKSNWTYAEIVSLVERALKTYFSDFFNKRCIFFDTAKKTCMIHNHRPLSCRLYGITPEEEYKSKAEKLRKLTENRLMARVTDQCPLVSTVNNEEITTPMTDSWWGKLCDIEVQSGVERSSITDDVGGTYRTYHDHILIHFFSNDMFEKLSAFKFYATPEEKSSFIESHIKRMNGSIKDKVGELDKK